MQAPHPEPRTKKRGSKGCMIAVLIALGVSALVLIIGGVFIYRLMQDPEVQKMVAGMQEGVSVYVEAAKAPGAAELRDLGCKQAMVVDTRRVVELVQQFEEDSEMTEAELDELVSPMLICQVGKSSTITCEQVVKTYVDAVPTAPEAMLAQVTTQSFGSEEVKCMGSYARDGTLIEVLDEDEMVPGADVGSAAGTPETE